MSARQTWPRVSTVVMGEVSESTWTVIAAEQDGVPQPGQVGRCYLRREAHFGFRAECDAWAEAQRAEGFTVGNYAHCATAYFGPTDSDGNCWLVSAEREVERA